jgi:hypothetical protein
MKFIIASGFFHESSSPRPLKITLVCQRTQRMYLYRRYLLLLIVMV